MFIKKVIFIDRDGVINKDSEGWTEHNYVEKWEDFIFMPNVIKALKKLCDVGYNIILISNQAGVSKGYYTQRQLEEINNKMERQIERGGAKIRKVYYCIHQTKDDCDCRKPKTGLFKRAENDLGVKTEGAFFIGDSKRDIEAGDKFKLKTVLVLSGKANIENVDSWEVKPDFIFKDLLEAVEFIIETNS